MWRRYGHCFGKSIFCSTSWGVGQGRGWGGLCACKSTHRMITSSTWFDNTPFALWVFPFPTLSILWHMCRIGRGKMNQWHARICHNTVLWHDRGKRDFLSGKSVVLKASGLAPGRTLCQLRLTCHIKESQLDWELEGKECCFVSRLVVWDSEVPWTVAHPAPLSMGFSRQEYWSELPCSPSRDLPNPGIKPLPPVLPALEVGSSQLSHWGSPANSLGQPVTNLKEYCD